MEHLIKITGLVLTILSASEINCFYSSVMKPCAVAQKFVNLNLKTYNILAIISMRFYFDTLKLINTIKGK